MRRAAPCSREKLDKTLETMKEDQGYLAEDWAEADAFEPEEPAMVSLVNLWSECGPVDASSYPLKCLQVNIEGPALEVIPYYHAGYQKTESEALVPGLLSLMLGIVENTMDQDSEAAQAPEEFLLKFTEEVFIEMRDKIRLRSAKAHKKR